MDTLITPKWTKGDTQAFIEYGDCFVPERGEQITILTELLATQQEEFHVVDLCSGPGLLAEAVLKKYPNATLHLFDASELMLEQATQRIKRFTNRYTIQEFDIFDHNWRKFNFTVNAFLSSLAIHHLDGEQKQQLYRDLYNALAEGGVFANADFIMPTNKTGLSIAGRSWDEETKRRSLKFYNNLTAYDVFRQLDWNYFLDPASDPIDKPSTVFEQLSWLDDIGYKGVDVYWLKAGHAVYGGFK